MKQVPVDQVETITVCPYCVSERDEFGVGCCGESSAHFETAYVYQDEIYLADEIELVVSQDGIPPSQNDTPEKTETMWFWIEVK